MTADQAPDRAARYLETAYQELRAIADHLLHEPSAGQTLQPTALVHEAFMRLARQDGTWANEEHFRAVAAKAMRQILTDHARRRHAAKRGGGWQRVTLSDCEKLDPQCDVDLVDLDEALIRLHELDERQARLVELRFFGGMDTEQTARALGVSRRTVELDWRMARAWLMRELSR